MNDMVVDMINRGMVFQKGGLLVNKLARSLSGL
jgi:hypothetical protein